MSTGSGIALAGLWVCVGMLGTQGTIGGDFAAMVLMCLAVLAWVLGNAK